jgi:hypothetical protein
VITRLAPAGTARRAPAGGPSAAQLARGRWVAIAAAPIRLCYPVVAWTGRVLVVVEPGFPPCPPAEVTYDPYANRWKTIARPPAIWHKGGVFLGSEPVAAFGGGRFLVVSPSTGKAIAWNSSTGRWAKVHPLPALGAMSATWTGRGFLVTTARQLRVNVGIARVFALAGSRWTALPSLPQPRAGRIAEAVPAASGGSVYALVSDAMWHTNQNDQYVSGSVRLLRLAGSSWIPVHLGAVAPLSQLRLAGAGGAVLAAGSACSALGVCLQEDGAAALLWPGRRTAVVPLRPRQGVPYPQDFAAGGHAVVVVYSDGIGGLPGQKTPAPGSSVIYDIRARPARPLRRGRFRSVGLRSGPPAGWSRWRCPIRVCPAAPEYTLPAEWAAGRCGPHLGRSSALEQQLGDARLPSRCVTQPKATKMPDRRIWITIYLVGICGAEGAECHFGLGRAGFRRPAALVAG